MPVPSAQPAAAAPLSGAARAYALQRTRIDKLQAQLAELDALDQAHRTDWQRWVHPLQQRQGELQRALVQALAAHLPDKALSTVQRQRAVAALCALAQPLAEAGDRDMAALHDRHSPQTLAQKRQATADALRARLEAALGGPLDGVDRDASAEAVLRAGMDRLRQADEDQRERRRAKAAARKARKAPSVQDAQQTMLQADADTTLRQLFRQLASALHPDREADPAQRQRKTALMSEANAAYGRKDLMGLMNLQVQARLADPQAVPPPSDDRLAALTLLLKQRVADLERERAARQQRMADEWALPTGHMPNANTLKQQLQQAVREREAVVAALARDLDRVQTPAGLKRWLNEQG
jgi:hypothetical protein